jgi:arsenate reductase
VIFLDDVCGGFAVEAAAHLPGLGRRRCGPVIREVTPNRNDLRQQVPIVKFDSKNCDEIRRLSSFFPFHGASSVRLTSVSAAAFHPLLSELFRKSREGCSLMRVVRERRRAILAQHTRRNSMITLYGIKNCDTMKKARHWLDAHKVAYVFHDYKAAGIDKETLAAWAKDVGWETLLNRAGTTFKKLPDADKKDVNEKKALALMLAQPSMIKRPVLDTGKKLVVGFKPEIYAAMLK